MAILFLSYTMLWEWMSLKAMKNWSTTSTRKMICALSRVTRWSGRPLKKQNSKGVKKDENIDHKKMTCCQQLQNLRAANH